MKGKARIARAFSLNTPCLLYTSMVTVCENFVCATYTDATPADRFIKERLSFVEIAFREREGQIIKLYAAVAAKVAQAEREAVLPPLRNQIRIPISGKPGDGVRAWNRQQNEAFQNLSLIHI